MRRNDPAIDFPIGRVLRSIGKRRCEDCWQRSALRGLTVCRICARRREQESGR